LTEGIDESAGEAEQLEMDYEAAEADAVEVEEVEEVEETEVEQEEELPLEFAEATEVEGLATELRAGAEAAEKAVTSDLSEIATSTGGRIEGLDNNLKEVNSLTRKINSDLRRYPDLTPGQAADGINDSLRYTHVFSPENYTQGVRDTLGALEQKGYTVVDTKNFWTEGSPYKGINATLKTPEGQPFELQLHTPESWNLKSATHDAFDISRADSTPEGYKGALDNWMAKFTGRLTQPPGVETIEGLIYPKPPL
jgi:hypothetical protein